MRSSTRTTLIEASLTVTAKLDRPVRRELMIGGHAYVVTLSPEGIKLVLFELDWESLVSGDAALAAGLNAMLAKAPAAPTTSPSTRATKPGKARA